MAAEAEEEVRLEVEAVAAMYGEDCRVVCDFPPHLVVHVRPNTADDSSQQVRFLPTLSTPKSASWHPVLTIGPFCFAINERAWEVDRLTGR
jgi:E3 ubiquitin-protein ligase RNF25